VEGLVAQGSVPPIPGSHLVQVALIPFIVAGDPDLGTTERALRTLAECGARHHRAGRALPPDPWRTGPRHSGAHSQPVHHSIPGLPPRVRPNWAPRRTPRLRLAGCCARQFWLRTVPPAAQAPWGCPLASVGVRSGGSLLCRLRLPEPPQKARTCSQCWTFCEE